MSMATAKQSSEKIAPVLPSPPGKKSRVQKSDTLKVTRKHGDTDPESEHAPPTAEVVSQLLLEETIEKASVMLYRRLMDRRCFTFAAYCTWRVILSNVELCSIAFDPGDKDLDALWQCEKLPEPAPLDSWAPGHLLERAVPPSAMQIQTFRKKAKPVRNEKPANQSVRRPQP
ncbi:hypothetical protein CSUI_005626 [Cystoisospora suis]|uniref:Uncharacterized protein n=1 Tax=Cystoisospora suis TaxID=483139 RepID=A0A2C6KWY2_9APIC|nr:hypothetical protein CSUI_005626 [Cystoisospora suis]